MRLNLIVLLTAVAIALMGCSGGGGMPLTPTIPGMDITDTEGLDNLRVGMMPDNGNFLWGLWQGTIDLASSQVELTPLRQVEFHMNMASVLQDYTPGLSYEFKGFDMIEKAVDVDVTITHPFPNTDFRGFDVRGIFMGPGNTVTSQSDPGIIYPALDGTRVLNADGYTRWWNAQEFTTAGKFGYDDPTVVPGFLIPEATLNPYKYFASCLSNDDPVVPNVNSSNRGTFSTEGDPPEVTRGYKIAFPTDGGYMKFLFHYAVDVSWAAPINGSPTPKPIGDFPPEANCPEPFHITVDTTGSTAFYKDETESGGDLQLAVEVFDWQAADDPMGITGQVESIWIESETLLNTFYGDGLTPVAGSQANSGIYNITIPNVTPTGLEGQEILITVRAASSNNSYAPPMSGPMYPQGAMLATYKLVDVPINSIEPDALTITSPNGGESWGISSSQNITWASYGEIENVNIDLSIDGGENYTINLATDVENDGSFTVDSVGDWSASQAKVRVSNSINAEVFDESDEVFTIEPFIRVDYPNGYEMIQAGSSPEIQWNASECISKVSIMLSQNSGVSYVIPLTYSTPNDGTYIFSNVPEGYIGDKNRIMIADASQPEVFDESDKDFKILPPLEDQILISKPTGGEVYIALSHMTIKWTGDPNIQNVGINLSLDSGQSWPEVIIDSVPNADSEFEWGPIPLEFVGTGRMIRIYDLDDPTVFADSGAFTIDEPGISIHTPNGGEVLEVGENFEITWSASDVITDVKIEMSPDSGVTYPYEITASTPNTGSYMWDPINDWPDTSLARIKISDAANPGLFNDESDADFSLMGRSITLISPLVGEEWRLGFPQTVNWDWTGNIPLVDVTISIDGGNYDTILAGNHTNTGVLEIGSFFPAELTQDQAMWTDLVRSIRIKVTASDNPVLTDNSDNDIIVQMTLGILEDKNDDAFGDADNDGIKDDIEAFLGMDPDNFDSDFDGMYDFKELFNTGWSWVDLIPDQDNDGLIAPADDDDNEDGVHDGELVDSDLDGVPNYLEYYGFTYNWLSGEFLKWDDEDVQSDFTVPYYKTDPMQPSTDQDPYDDGMEVSGLMMDQSVEEPGDSPVIPAMPNIVIELIGYKVTLNADIADAEGGAETEGTSWTRETSRSSTTTDESNWGVEVNAKFSFSDGLEIGGSTSYGGSHSTSSTTGTSEATEESHGTEVNWSTTTTTNPTEAAAIKLFLKVRNTGTACASNIIPSFTLMVGKHPVATFEQGNAQINLLAPGGVYPAGDIPWIIDSIDTGAGVSPIYLTLNELKAFETGAPISIVMIQMLADVAAMDEYGHWQYVGDWNEYMARVDAVCAHLYLDPGDGNVLSYMVYADDDPSAPTVILRDAYLWSGAYEDEVEQTIFMPYRQPNGDWSNEPMDLNGFSYYVDTNTYNAILSEDNAMDVVLTPDAYIVGKAPPEPPLDAPVIHWAGWDSEAKIVYASVTDYFAVKNVWCRRGPDTFEMSYDEALGCYSVILDDYVEGDQIEAENVAGIHSFHDVYPMAVPLEVSYPEISDPFFEIREEKSYLRAIAGAKIEDDHSPITEVLLIDYLENPIGPMIYDSITDKYYYSEEIEPDFQPAGNERIRAFNESGHSTTLMIPATEYFYPTEFHSYDSYKQLCSDVDLNWYTWDFDIHPPSIQYVQEGLPIVNSDSDFAANYHDFPDYSLTLQLAGWPTSAHRWTQVPFWDPMEIPTREYLKMLNDENLIKYQDPIVNPYGNAVVMVTTNGRLAFMTFPVGWMPSSVYHMGSYSLYDGPWRYIDVIKPVGETINYTADSIEINWNSFGVPGDVRILIVYGLTTIVCNDVTPNDGSYIYDPAGVFAIGTYSVTISDVSKPECLDFGFFYAIL